MTVSYTGVNGGTFPNVIVGPAAGEFITQASVGYTAQGAANECKHLFDIKASLAGATFTGLVTCGADLYIPTGATFLVQSGGGFGLAEGAVASCSDAFTLTGSATTPARIVFGTRSRLNIPITRVTDASQTLNASDDGPVLVLTTPTAARTLTIEQASDTVAANGDTLTFYLPVPGTVGNYFRIAREGSGNFIVDLNGTIAGNQEACFCRIHLEGGVWRLTGGVGISPGTDA